MNFELLTGSRSLNITTHTHTHMPTLIWMHTHLHPYIHVITFIFFTNTLGKGPLAIMVSMFANDPGDCGSIPYQAIPKTPKIVLDAPLLNTAL